MTTSERHATVPLRPELPGRLAGQAWISTFSPDPARKRGPHPTRGKVDTTADEQRANAPELDAHIAEVEARGLCEPDEPHSKMTPIGDGKHRLKLTFRQSVMVRRIQALLDEPLSPGEVVHFALDAFGKFFASTGKHFDAVVFERIV